MGHEVTVAHNGRSAVDHLQTANAFDLVFMDVHMPEMDGYSATEAIRAWETGRGLGEHVPIIAMTASAMAGDREKRLKSRNYHNFTGVVEFRLLGSGGRIHLMQHQKVREGVAQPCFRLINLHRSSYTRATRTKRARSNGRFWKAPER